MIPTDIQHSKQNNKILFTKTISSKSFQKHKIAPSFDNYTIRKKQSPFHFSQSPFITERITDLKIDFNDCLVNSLINKQTVSKTNIDRKKYQSIKERIKNKIQQLQKNNFQSIQEAFQLKKVILNDFLDQFTNSIQKQCKQKGEILKFIWNSMFGMIEKISQKLCIYMRKTQKIQLQRQIKSHQQYQQLIQTYKKKQKNFNDKFKLQRQTVNNLVYELRFKRKQINKLYMYQKILINKLNQIKFDHINLQTQYIDLLCNTQQMSSQQAKKMMDLKSQIMKNKDIQFALKNNKKNNKDQIKKQLKLQKQNQIQQLYQQIRQISETGEKNKAVVASLIQAAVQNYSIKFQTRNQIDSNIITSIIKKSPTNTVETQTSYNMNKFKNTITHMTSFDYYQKIQSQIVDNKSTQTLGQSNKKIYGQEKAIQVNPQYLKDQFPKFIRIVKTLNIIYFKQKNKTFYNQAIPQQFLQQMQVPQEFLNKRNQKKHQSNLIENKNYINNHRASDIKAIQSNKYNKRITHNVSIQKRQDFNLKNKINNLTSNNQNKINRISKITTKSNSSKMSNILQIQPNTSNHKSIIDEQRLSQQILSIISQTSNQNINKNRFSRFKQQYQKQKIQPNTPPIINQYKKLSEDLTRHLIPQKKINIVINKEKQQQIINLFHCKREKIQNNILKNKLILNSINAIDTNSSNNKRHRDYDVNNMIFQLCRNTSKLLQHKKKQNPTFEQNKEIMQKSIKIDFITKDVEQLSNAKAYVKHISGRNVKNFYKVIMMTFAKAYQLYYNDYHINNLAYPLFQSLTIVYGRLHQNQIYKKLINFIAYIKAEPQNSIFRFFVFLLGMDQKNPYSQKLTTNEIYLSLNLLQKMSVQGKIRFNIQSLYTDTTRLQEDLSIILKQQKLNENLIYNIQERLAEDISNSTAAMNYSQCNQGTLRLNIYNIILLIIQQSIKWKQKNKK